MSINWIELLHIEEMIVELDEKQNMDFDAATDGEWVDTYMQPSGVTLTSLNVSVISVDSVSCGLMHLF